MLTGTLKLFSENVIPQKILQLNHFRPDRNLTKITNGNNLIRSVDTGHPYMLRIRHHSLRHLYLLLLHKEFRISFF